LEYYVITKEIYSMRIYNITNLKTGELYIGATSKTLDERFESHIMDSRRSRCKDRPLYHAINKYGIENFSIDLIEQVSSEVSETREKYWIKLLNTSKNGYNHALGGKGRPEYEHDDVLYLYKQKISNVEIARILGCCIDTVRDILKKYNIKSNNFDYCEAYGIPISQYSKDGKLLRVFKSSGEASRYLSENKDADCSTMRSHIREVANGKRNSAYGYVWKNYSP
jgi:hypothetical protein